jgi:hypothetical protein
MNYCRLTNRIDVYYSTVKDFTTEIYTIVVAN